MLGPHKWTYPASHGKRAIAFFIDSVICQFLSVGILAVVPQSAMTKLLVTGFLPVMYFTLFQTYWYWTPGKKVMGLELAVRDSDQGPSFTSVLGRETVGRFLNVLTLGIGYLMILFTANHEGLHDKIFRTQVVTHNSPEESASIGSWLLRGLASLTVVAGLCFYVFFFTSAPLKEFAKKLEVSGIQTDGIEGNLANGVSVASLMFSSDEGDITAENLVFSYENIFQMFLSNHVRIQEISISKMTINIRENRQPTQPQSQIFPNPKDTSKPGFAQPKKIHFQLFVDRVDINSVKVTYKGTQVAQITRLYSADLQATEKELTLARFWFDSNQFLVDAQNLIITKEELSLGSGNVILKKTFKPELLVSDADLQIQAKFNWKNKSYQGKIQAFRKAVTAKVQGGQIELSARNFQPHWYIRNLPPLHSLNLDVKGSFQEIAFAPRLKGTYIIGNRVFKLIENAQIGFMLPAESEGPGKKIISRIQFQGFHSQIPAFKVSLESPNFNEISPTLSELYYSKPLSHLTAQQTLALKQNLPYFQFNPQTRLPASQMPQWHPKPTPQ